MAKSPSTKQSSANAIELAPLQIATVQIVLVGDTPLIVHAWSEKAKKMMLDRQMKKPLTPKAAKSPEEEYESAFYRFPDGRYGFPAVGVKAAMVSACRYVEARMTVLRGAFHIDGELVEVIGTPRPREDMVRVGLGVADIRYRPEFPEWRIPVTIKYNLGAVTLEQLLNLLNVAGFGVGIGEWRPERNGNYGRFHVATEGEL